MSGSSFTAGLSRAPQFASSVDMPLLVPPLPPVPVENIVPPIPVMMTGPPVPPMPVTPAPPAPCKSFIIGLNPQPETQAATVRPQTTATYDPVDQGRIRTSKV